MTREEAIATLQEMESRFQSGFSSIDRRVIESLYYTLCGKTVSNSGCGNCYRDAYLEIYHKIKSLKEMPKKSDYTLKPGALVTFFGEPVAYSNANLTDEVAERYLAQNKDLINQFQTFPLDYEKRIAARLSGEEYVPSGDADEADALKQLVEQLTQENAALKAENSELQEQIQRLAEAESEAAEAESAETTETEAVAEAETEAEQPAAAKAKKAKK